MSHTNSTDNGKKNSNRDSFFCGRTPIYSNIEKYFFTQKKVLMFMFARKNNFDARRIFYITSTSHIDNTLIFLKYISLIEHDTVTLRGPKVSRLI